MDGVLSLLWSGPSLRAMPMKATRSIARSYDVILGKLSCQRSFWNEPSEKSRLTERLTTTAELTIELAGKI